jgi:hypothetical protein
LWLGVAAYAAYDDAFYLFGAALNAFFPLYVLALLVASTILVETLTTLEMATLKKPENRRTRHRVVAVYLGTLGIGLATFTVVAAVLLLRGGRRHAIAGPPCG